MPKPKMSTEERFWSCVNRGKDDGCWLWTGKKDRYGYGIFRSKKKGLMAHRFAYQLLVGPIPPGFELDHLCRNTSCVNPTHLEAVTHRINVLRGFSARNSDHVAKPKKEERGAWMSLYCKRGHPLFGSNMYLNKQGYRVCRACHKIYQEPFIARRKAWQERNKAVRSKS